MSLKKQAFSGLVWSFALQFSSHGVGFIVSIILARLLLPEEFGLIGMISVFIGIGGTLLDAGLTQSLIRSLNPDQEDYSTVFLFNLIGSVIVYFLVFLLAPLIAEFYNQKVLIDIIRVYCLIFIIKAFSAVQSTRLTKQMDFKTQMIVALPSLIISSIVGIAMAYLGYGVWSLVWSAIINALFATIQLWFYSEWTPSFVFNMDKFKIHFRFGYKLTLSGLLDIIFSNIYQIVIGKYFSPVQVGFYTRAETFKQLPISSISGALHNVTYPLFASIQDDNERLKRVYKQIMQMVVFFIAPILIFLAVLAEPTFRFLFTEKWLPSVPYFQIICFTGILYPIHAYNLNILNVKGRSDLFLKLEIIKKVIIAISVIVALQFGVFALLWSQIVISVVAFYINTHFTGKILNYNSWEQTKDIFPIIMIAIIAGCLVFGLDYFLEVKKQFDIIRIIAGCIIGLVTYIGLAFLLKMNLINDFKLLILRK
ncbi:MAG: lipopolysaccharide biosynthesis protein [Bacteroidota bacterium]